MLDYERLDAYRLAIENCAFAFTTVSSIPRGHAALIDQWKRAAMSVPLNIAEGSGKTSPADRANRYSIARGEAMECGAILDVLAFLRVVPDQELKRAKDRVRRLVQMLSKMAR